MKSNLAIYQAKRPVAAARIVDTYPDGIRNSKLTVEDSKGQRTVLEVGVDWFDTHRPHEDGYYLDFGNGYTGFMAAHAFDRLYSLDTDFREVGEAEKVPGGVIAIACRRAFDNIYHKVRAETTFDHFRYICTSFLEQLQRIEPVRRVDIEVTASTVARGLAAQAWCEPFTSHIVMDDHLAEAFARILDRFIRPSLDYVFGEATQTTPPLMVFDPKDGMRDVYPSEARQYREWHGKVAWLYNPFTGESRTPEDIGSDPFGLLIVAPAKKTPAEGHHV